MKCGGKCFVKLHDLVGKVDLEKKYIFFVLTR